MILRQLSPNTTDSSATIVPWNYETTVLPKVSVIERADLVLDMLG